MFLFSCPARPLPPWVSPHNNEARLGTLYFLLYALYSQSLPPLLLNRRPNLEYISDESASTYLTYRPAALSCSTPEVEPTVLDKPYSVIPSSKPSEPLLEDVDDSPCHPYSPLCDPRAHWRGNKLHFWSDPSLWLSVQLPRQCQKNARTCLIPGNRATCRKL